VLVSREAKKNLSKLLSQRGLSSGQRKGHGRRNTQRHGYPGGPDGAHPSELVVPSRRAYSEPDPDPQLGLGYRSGISLYARNLYEFRVLDLRLSLTKHFGIS